MKHNLNLLQGALPSIEQIMPEVLEILGGGYFSAFADGGSEWDSRLRRAAMILRTVAPRMSGVDETLTLVLEYFTDLKRRNIQAARHFGNAVCRMHPDTVDMVRTIG